MKTRTSGTCYVPLLNFGFATVIRTLVLSMEAALIMLAVRFLILDIGIWTMIASVSGQAIRAPALGLAAQLRGGCCS